MAGSATLTIRNRALHGVPAATCCGAAPVPADRAAGPLAALAAAFGFSILAHALTLGALPLAGTMLAPAPALAYLPFVALLAGALCGARLGALVVGSYGWRAHATAGSLCGSFAAALAAIAILGQAFTLLVVAAILLGLAQALGFGLRHGSAVLAGGEGPSWRGGIVLATGGFAAIAGPWLAVQAETATAPYLMLGTFCLIALVHLAALPLVPSLAPSRMAFGAIAAPSMRSDPSAVTAAHAARLAWFAMAAGMAHAPLAMLGCGIAPGGIGSVIAWHVLAMYAPAAPAALLVGRLGPRTVALTGSTLAVAGLVLLPVAATPAGFLVAMVSLGIGWSMATVAAQAATAGASGLMRQETGLFAAALAGALAGIALA